MSTAADKINTIGHALNIMKEMLNVLDSTERIRPLTTPEARKRVQLINAIAKGGPLLASLVADKAMFE